MVGVLTTGRVRLRPDRNKGVKHTYVHVDKVLMMVRNFPGLSAVGGEALAKKVDMWRRIGVAVIGLAREDGLGISRERDSLQFS